ncbi:hypothetical protein ACIGHG_18520 [Bacillus sp. NPDC077411]|uniref:hypothetical protein n=1 Tax=Bacillus sp. NPDC077411 TaxID=3363947 RepID=UPI0037CB0F45
MTVRRKYIIQVTLTQSTINQFITMLGTIYYASHPKIDEIKYNSDMKMYELTCENYNDVLTKVIYELRKKVFSSLKERLKSKSIYTSILIFQPISQYYAEQK